MIKRGTARRLGIKRPSEPVDFRKFGISITEFAETWPAQRRFLLGLAGQRP